MSRLLCVIDVVVVDGVVFSVGFLIRFVCCFCGYRRCCCRNCWVCAFVCWLVRWCVLVGFCVCVFVCVCSCVVGIVVVANVLAVSVVVACCRVCVFFLW